MPPLERHETVKTEAEVAGVELTANPFGAAGWEITIRNTTQAGITVAWDESTFVNSTGESRGRLIRGETRKMDVASAQPPTPLAAGARLTQVVLVEKETGTEEMEIEFRKWGRVLSRGLFDKFTDYRAKVHASIVGGSLNITVQLADGKKTWIGRVIE